MKHKSNCKWQTFGDCECGAIAEYGHLMMKNGLLEFSEVAQIEELDETYDVYDITVENTHNFFANGMLVHNCVGGIFGNDYWRNREQGDSAVLAAMEKTAQQMISIFGDRFYGELQWGNYKEQHIINQFIIFFFINFIN